jgi:hypothetical protein
VGWRAARDRAHAPFPSEATPSVRRRRHVALDARVEASGSGRGSSARDEAIELQAALAGVPVGIASFTDRVLPHLFPTVDQRVYRETMREAVGIERRRHRRASARTSRRSTRSVPCRR